MFGDIISTEAELRQLKIDCEEMAQEVKDYKGMTNILQKQRQELSYLLKEASLFMHEFREHVPEDIFKLCEKNADKNYQDFIKETFELDQIKVGVTLKGP